MQIRTAEEAADSRMGVGRKKSHYCRSEAEARKMFRMAAVAGKNSLTAVVENFLTARE